MAWFWKKQDPIAARQRALNAQIAALEGRIHQLQQRVADDQAQPKPRSSARPQPGADARGRTLEEPTFEEVTPPARNPFEGETTPEHFNELGVRKYDVVAAVRRWLRHWRPPPTPNPKLVSFLAAGSIHGLRPLRYERRIARNRFLATCAFFVAMLWGLIYFYLRNR